MKQSWFFLPAASTTAVKVDHLMWYLIVVCGFFALLIAALIVILAVRYHARPGHIRQPNRSLRSATLTLEIFWTVIPLGLSLVMFFWAGALYVDAATPPPGETEDIWVVGKQWMWKLQHANGAREINELHVPRGREIRLVMTSEDVIHSFYVPAFRVKMDVLPTRYTYLRFKPTMTGSFHLFCAEFCGTQHSRMTGRIIVQEPGEYEHWLTQRRPARTAAAAGEELFAKSGCPSCHRSTDANRGPVLDTVYGSTVLLDDGTRVLADEEYLRESIVDPAAKVVFGYTPIMPNYRNTFSSEELQQLVAYLKELATEPIRRPDQRILNGNQ